MTVAVAAGTPWNHGKLGLKTEMARRKRNKMKKKLLVLAMALMLVLGMTACGGNSAADEKH
jgi:hypothetical protein